MLIVFSRAFEFIKEAWRRIDKDDDFYSAGNESINAADKIVKNVLEPLATKIGDIEPFINLRSLPTWPPFFFYDNDPEQLSGVYDAKIPPGEGAAAAERLIAMLDQYGIPEDISNGEKCILRIARDWEEWVQATSRWDTRALQEWTIRALCAFYDQSDRGFGLLTDILEGYMTGGPTARNHADERYRDFENAFSRFNDFLESLSQTEGNERALEDLRGARKLFMDWKKNYYRGIELKTGVKCQKRIEIAKENANPILVSMTQFSAQDAIRDVVNDCVSFLVTKPQKLGEQDIESIKSVFNQCLIHDPVLAEMMERDTHTVRDNVDVLSRLQAVVMERIARVIDFVVDSDDEALRTIARRYFDLDVDEADLLMNIRKSELCRLTPADTGSYDKVTNAYLELKKVIEGIHIGNPFVKNKEVAMSRGGGVR